MLWLASKSSYWMSNRLSQVQEVVELVLGVGDVDLCKGQLCSCKISARPRGSYKNLTGKLIG